jgi:hypothetical protein
MQKITLSATTEQHLSDPNNMNYTPLAVKHRTNHSSGALPKNDTMNYIQTTIRRITTTDTDICIYDIYKLYATEMTNEQIYDGPEDRKYNIHSISRNSIIYNSSSCMKPASTRQCSPHGQFTAVCICMN